MYFPFRRELDEIFSGDLGIPWKMAGGAIVAACFVVAETLRGFLKGDLPIEATPWTIGGIAAVSAALGAALALLLSLGDIVKDRDEKGEPISLPLRILFAMGGPLVAWLVIALVLTLAIIYASGL